MLKETATDRVGQLLTGVVDHSFAKGDHLGRSGCREVAVHGIVLAGVHAWGDCPLENAVCRPLLPVASRPLITHALTWIRKSGINGATVCGNSDTGALRQRLGNGKSLGIALEYFEDVMPRGPAGCVRDAAATSTADLFVVVDGTIVPRVDLEAVIAHHLRADAVVTLVAAEVDGCCEPLGIYVFARCVLDRISPTGYQDIKEALIPALYARGERVVTHVVRGPQAVRVTDAASYLGVNIWATEQVFRSDELPAEGRRNGDACVHPSAHVDPRARFVGPVLVGPNSMIGADALIVGPCTIGAGTRVGAEAVVSRSAVWDRCTVGDGAIVDHCVLADGARLEPGMIVRETVCLPQQRLGETWLARIAARILPRATQVSL